MAKKSCLESELSKDKYSPYYWAGFIYIGSGNKESVAGNNNNNKWWWLGGAAITIVIFFIFIMV